jgi:hypothetical protein
MRLSSVAPLLARRALTHHLRVGVIVEYRAAPYTFVVTSSGRRLAFAGVYSRKGRPTESPRFGV